MFTVILFTYSNILNKEITKKRKLLKRKVSKRKEEGMRE